MPTGRSSVGLAVTSRLAEFVCSRSISVPLRLLEVARDSLIDTVGVTIAGRGEPTVQVLRSTLGERLPSGRCSVLVNAERTDPMTASLLNGTAGHALDYDDVNDLTIGHPSVVIWPAALAIAEEVEASGRELLDAYVVGLEVSLVVASGMDVECHYARGWHSTATIGVLGATAAAVRLWALDPLQTRHALGVAASLASGSRQNFGTMTKPLHAGTAARNAVFAVALARNGFTADPDQLEAPLGYFAMFDGNGALGPALDDLGKSWLALQYGLNVKKYPCCYNTHRIADAAMQLVHEHRVPASDVEHVTITVEPGGLGPLIHHRPSTGLQGKFSAEYVVSTVILNGRVDLGSFTDEEVNRPEAHELIERMETRESRTPPSGPAAWDDGYAVVCLELTGGRSYSRRVDVPTGHCSTPMELSGLAAKFADCLEFSRAPWDAGALLAELLDTERRPVFNGFDSMFTN